MSIRSIVISLLFLFSSGAMAIEACHTGSWYDPDRDGEGVNIEVIDGITVAYLYTFDHEDRPSWYTMLGDQYLAMYQTVVVPDKTEFITKTQPVGVAQFELLTDDIIYFNYLIDIVYKDGLKYECNYDRCKGSYVYRRITQPIPCPK